MTAPWTLLLLLPGVLYLGCYLVRDAKRARLWTLASKQKWPRATPGTRYDPFGNAEPR